MPLDTSRDPLMCSIEPAYPFGTLHKDQLPHSGYTMSAISPYQVIPGASLPRLGQIMDMYPCVKIGNSRHVLPNYRFSWARACPQQHPPTQNIHPVNVQEEGARTSGPSKKMQNIHEPMDGPHYHPGIQA